jgi:hypothetical protein
MICSAPLFIACTMLRHRGDAFRPVSASTQMLLLHQSTVLAARRVTATNIRILGARGKKNNSVTDFIRVWNVVSNYICLKQSAHENTRFPHGNNIIYTLFLVLFYVYVAGGWCRSYERCRNLYKPHITQQYENYKYK